MLNPSNLHHAYLLEGEKELIFKELTSFLEKELNFSVFANPDFYLGDFDTFGIEDGRKIKSFQSNKPIGDNKQIIIIKTNFITTEAQNSLLKMFEEPTEDTHIFLITPSSENFLDTLKSRLQIISVAGGENNEGTDFVKEFLSSSISDRFEMIRVFHEHKKGEKANKAGAIQFLNNLESYLYKEHKKEKDIKNIFNEINTTRSYLNDRSPSTKMLLEHISQIIPKI